MYWLVRPAEYAQPKNPYQQIPEVRQKSISKRAEKADESCESTSRDSL